MLLGASVFAGICAFGVIRALRNWPLSDLDAQLIAVCVAGCLTVGLALACVGKTNWGAGRLGLVTIGVAALALPGRYSRTYLPAGWQIVGDFTLVGFAVIFIALALPRAAAIRLQQRRRDPEADLVSTSVGSARPDPAGREVATPESMAPRLDEPRDIPRLSKDYRGRHSF
jgi:hypothetical protein